MFKALGCIAQVVALVFAALFIITTLLVLFLFNVEQQLFDPSLYKRALAEQRIYERFPALAAEQIVRMSIYNPCAENPELERCKLEGERGENPLASVFTSPSPQLRDCVQQALGEQVFNALASGKRLPKNDEIQLIKPCLRQFGLPRGMASGTGGPPIYLWMPDEADWEAILSALLPAAWLRTQVESVIDQLFAYLDSKSDSVRISLVEFKTRLAGDAGMTILLRLLRAQPLCTKEQLASLTSVGAGAEIDKLLVCRPPEEILTKIAPQILTFARAAITKLPDEAVLPLPSRRQIANSSSKAEGLEGVVRLLPLIRLLMRTSPLLPAALLLLIALFGVRSLKGLLLWWGVPLLIVGLIGGGLALVALLGMDWSIATFIPTDQALVMGFTSNLVQTGLGVGKHIVRTLVMWIGGEAGIIGLLGLVLLVSSLFVKGKRPTFAGTPARR